MSEEINERGLKFDPNAIGTSGLRQYGGFVSEEFLKDLRGLNGARTYREMADNDPIVGSILFAISMMIRQVEWTVQAVDDSPEAEAAKDFVEEVMGDMSTSWNSLIVEICSMFTYGFAPMEIVWKKRVGPDEADPANRSAYTDGKIGIRTIALRAQSTIVKWLIDPDDGSIDGVYQQPWSGGMVLIPIEKLLLFRTTEERNNPEGRSVLRNAYRPWYFKKRLEEIESIGVERDLAGLPIAYMPSSYFDLSADLQQKATLAAWQRMVTNIKRDKSEGLVIPSDRYGDGSPMFDIKLLSTAGSRQLDTSKIIDRYNKGIATTVLADFVLLGQSGHGSFAMSKNKTDVFSQAISAFVKSIGEVFNQHLMPRLWRLNGLDYELMPTIVPGDLERPDLSGLADFIQKLTASGAQMFPDRELENHLREIAGLPLAPEDATDDPSQDPTENPETDPQPAPPGQQARAAAAGGKSTDDSEGGSYYDDGSGDGGD